MQLVATQTTKGLCIPIQYPPVKRNHNPDMLCPHTLGDESPAVTASVTISTLHQNSESEQREIQNFDRTKISNSESGTPPQAQYDHNTQPIPLHERPLYLRLQRKRLDLFSQLGRRDKEHARHQFPGTLRPFQSFPDHLDDDGVSASHPLDSRDAPDVALALVFQLLENVEELARNLELVVGV